MFIDAIINGEILTREEVPDDYLAPVESISWEDNVEARQQIVALYLEVLQKKIDRIFGETKHTVTYQLVFQSKMTEHEESLESNIGQ